MNYAPNCAGTGGTFTVHVIFPTCLDPQTNAVAYEPCPRGLHDDLPQLTERIMYPIQDARAVMLASGPVYTFHADFYNSWNQEACGGCCTGSVSKPLRSAADDRRVVRRATGAAGRA